MQKYPYFLGTVAESRQESNAGIHNANFVQRLQASIVYDRNMHTPNVSGYNGDGSDRMGVSEQHNRYINGGVVEYNGTAFYDSNHKVNHGLYHIQTSYLQVILQIQFLLTPKPVMRGFTVYMYCTEWAQ